MNNPNTNVIAPTIRFNTVFVSSGVICITFKNYILILINEGRILRGYGLSQLPYQILYRNGF